MQRKRAGIYLRVSSAGQEDNYSLPTQDDGCRAWSAAHGCDVVAVYKDVWTGAEVFERPDLGRCRADMRAGAFDVLVVYALDRLSRDQNHLGLVLSEAEHAGVAWASATEDIDNSPTGKILRAVVSGMAELERMKIAERTSRGKRARVAAGKPPVGCRPPYGLVWADPANKDKLAADPETAPIVRRIFAHLAAGGSARQLAISLTAEGVPTPTRRGTHWHYSTVRAIVGHPAYTGTVEAYRWKRTRTRGKYSQTLRPAAERVAVAGAAPVLVEPEVAAAARDRLARNKTLSARNNRDPEAALLRGGYVRCGYCGHTMRVMNHKSGTLYRCETGNRDKFGCPHHCIMAGIIDGAVWERVEAVLTRPEIVATEVARLRADDPTTADMAAIDRRLAEVTRRQRNLTARLADEDDDDVAELVLADVRALADQRRRLEAERDGLAAQRAAWAGAQSRLTDLEAWCRNVAANLGAMGYAERRTAIEALGVEVRVWATDHTPRHEISMRLDVLGEEATVSGPRAASGGDPASARVDGCTPHGCAKRGGRRGGRP